MSQEELIKRAATIAAEAEVRSLVNPSEEEGIRLADEFFTDATKKIEVLSSEDGIDQVGTFEKVWLDFARAYPEATNSELRIDKTNIWTPMAKGSLRAKFIAGEQVPSKAIEISALSLAEVHIDRVRRPNLSKLEKAVPNTTLLMGIVILGSPAKKQTTQMFLGPNYRIDRFKIGNNLKDIESKDYTADTYFNNPSAPFYRLTRRANSDELRGGYGIKTGDQNQELRYRITNERVLSSPWAAFMEKAIGSVYDEDESNIGKLVVESLGLYSRSTYDSPDDSYSAREDIKRINEIDTAVIDDIEMMLETRMKSEMLELLSSSATLELQDLDQFDLSIIEQDKRIKDFIAEYLINLVEPKERGTQLVNNSGKFIQKFLRHHRKN
jgi:hypothetical protein